MLLFMLYNVYRFEDEVGLPSYPEMIFDQNSLKLEISGGDGLCFNAEDALKLVDKENDFIKVAETTQWKEARYFTFLLILG